MPDETLPELVARILNVTAEYPTNSYARVFPAAPSGRGASGVITSRQHHRAGFADIFG